jgi:hypothetical protein
VAEAVAKIRAFGFIVPHFEAYPAYWKDPWNRIDFFVLCVSILDITGLGARLGNNTIRALRVLRALRPLRLLNRCGVCLCVHVYVVGFVCLNVYVCMHMCI